MIALFTLLMQLAYLTRTILSAILFVLTGIRATEGTMAFTGRPRKEDVRREREGTFIGYVRGSTVQQEITLEAQQARMRQYCRLNNLVLVDLVTEVACSTSEREKLADVQRRLEAGEAEGLLCAKIDRVGRSQIHLSKIVEWAVTKRIDILSTDEGWQIKDGKKVNKMLPSSLPLPKWSTSGSRTALGRPCPNSRPTASGWAMPR
jgi:predicted site-specific integrase-resolvase